MPFAPEKDPGLIPQVLSMILDSCVNGITLADPDLEDMPLVYANKVFEDMTGYSQDEIIGRNCRFLQGDDREQEARYQLKEAIRKRQSLTVTVRNYRKNGELFYNRLFITPLFDSEGKLLYYLGDQYDVTAQVEGDREIQLFPDSQDWLSFEGGQVIFREGEPGDVMYVVIDGEVDIMAHDERIATVSGPAGIVGEMALIDTGPRSARAVAKTKCTVVPLSRDRFLSYVQHKPGFSIEVMQVMCERLRRMLLAAPTE
jgi:PAS domain S-box-containing protein